MNTVLAYVSQKSLELAKHPLYRWIRDNHAQNPLRKLDPVLPILGFIVSFPYYNLLYLASSKTGFSNEEQHVYDLINEHAKEDAGHLKLFIRDMQQFSLHEIWGFNKVSDVLWAIWSAPLLESSRKLFHQRIRSLLTTGDDLFFRYLHIEQLEMDGHFLFSAFTNASEAIHKNSSKRLRYFGKTHLAREEGHLPVSFQDLSNFSAPTREKAVAIIDEKHYLSLQVNEIMLDFASKSAGLTHPNLLLSSERSERQNHVKKAVIEHQQGHIPPLKWSISPQKGFCDERLFQVWMQQHQRFLDHPLFHFLVSTDEIEKTLRLVMIYFANRMLALNTLNLFDLDQDDKNSEFAQVYAKIRAMFSTHFALFFHDWDVLDIDNYIGVNCADFINRMFADKQHAAPEMTALHEFRRQAIQVANTPALKFGCYLAINSMATAFTKATQVLAQKYYKAHGVQLPYMEGLLHLCYKDKDEDWNNPDKIKILFSMSLTNEEMQVINSMFDTICTLGMHQWDLLNNVLRFPSESRGFLQ